MATQSGPRKPKLVRCPTCGGDSVYGPENRYRPFCSERCKNIDLGAWASESFRVAEQPAEDDPDTTASTDSPAASILRPPQ